MTFALIVFFGVAVVGIIGFGIGYAVGFNVAKHPGKVEQQVKDVVEQIRK